MIEPTHHSTGFSVLGPEHDAEARRMTKSSAVAVLAVAAVLSLLCAPLVLALPIVLMVYVVSEAVFAVLYWYRFLLLSYQPIKHRPLSHDPISALQRTLQHLQQDGADIRAFLSIWFHGAPVESIRRGNMKDLIAYAFWYKTPSEVAAEGRDAELDQQVATIEAMWGLSLQPGYDPQLTCMAHLWEPMKHWYKPLAFYLVMEAAALLCRVALHAAGFKRHVWMGLAYYTRNMPAQPVRHSIDIPADMHGGGWHRYSRATSMPAQRGRRRSQDVPLVLLHGIGMGLIPYTSMLFNMAATGQPVLALELPHVSQRWVLWVPTVDEVAEVVVSILNRNDISRCCLVGHSYGSAVASRLLQQVPERIQQLCLIDPICFAMFMPNLLRNFLYESPHSGSWLGDFMMMSAARDLHVSATLSRRFFWSDVNLWEEQIPADTLVVLSGRDALMAAPQVRSWLEEHTQAVVMYHPDLAHAAFLLDIRWQQQILQQLFMLLDSKQASTGMQKAGQHFPPGGPRRVQLAGMQANGGSMQNGDMLHMANGAASAPFAPGAGAGAGPTDSCASGAQQHPEASASSISSFSDCSEHSYVSCEDGSSDGSSNGSSLHRYMAAAVHTSHAELPASPFSSFSHTDRIPDRSLDYFGTGAGLSSFASGKLASHNSCGSNSNHVLAQYPSRSRDGSLELASSLCMRSWSGVLPCASVTDASTASESGAPESPRSCNTFISASSVQSRRSLAATAAAAEARQAAQMLLQPLLAMQQRGQNWKQPGPGVDSKQVQTLGEPSLRRITWGSNASGDFSAAYALRKSTEGGADVAAGAGLEGATAGVECLVSYRSFASDSTSHKQQQGQSAEVVLAAVPAVPAVPPTPPIEPHRVREVVALPQVDGSPPSIATAAAGRGLLGLKMRPSLGKGPGVPNGVLKRVEGLWQGRRARTAARKGSQP